MLDNELYGFPFRELELPSIQLIVASFFINVIHLLCYVQSDIIYMNIITQTILNIRLSLKSYV